MPTNKRHIFSRMLAVVSLSAFLAAGCKRDQFYLYNDGAMIQFGPDKSLIYYPSAALRDTLKEFTFFYEKPEVTADTVWFDIYAIGKTVDKDRPFKLMQETVPNEVNAVPGKDYVPFDDPKSTASFLIRAGGVHTRVPVLLLRDPGQKTANVLLKFKVVENEAFKPGEVSHLWRKVTITDRLSKPAKWSPNDTQWFLGEYSVTKHKFMIDVTGERWDDDFFTRMYNDGSLYINWCDVLKIALTQYNQEHPGAPMRDENGQLIIFP